MPTTARPTLAGNAKPTQDATIQQTIEDLLSQIHNRPVSVNGCSRTDAGVHATQFYAYFRTDDPLPNNYVFFVNKELPPDIALLEIVPVKEGAHARLDATSRTYDYFFHDHEDVWLARTSGRVDLSKFAPQNVSEVLSELLKQTDFRAFCKTPDRHNSTISHIYSATLFQNRDGNRFRLRFVANRFLRGMIRLLVNELLRVGTGDLSADAFVELLVSGERPTVYRLAPADGLYLTGVTYPYISRKPDLPLCGMPEWIAF